MKNSIWLITGISSGLGKALAQTVMAQGDFLIGTFRQQEQTDRFNEQHVNKALAVTLDITEPAQIENVVAHIKNKIGHVDVLVNNAGFGFAGAIEESNTDEVKAVFEANFFGTLKLTQSLLPLFREKGRGHIIQISSHGGFKAFAGFGIYNASKFALEGFSEALAAEVAPLGIHVTIVEPGPFRTNFAGHGFKLAKQIIPDYNATAGVFRKKIKSVDGKQEGDPDKAAHAIYNITKLEAPPLRLPLGTIAVQSITSKLESVRSNLDDYRKISESVVF